MRIPFFTTLFFIFAVVGSTFVYIAFSHLLYSTQESYSASIIVDDSERDLYYRPLDYGVVKPGNYVKRTLNLTSERDSPVTVDISAQGHLAHWMTLTQNQFSLAPFESKQVDIYVTIPSDAEYGEYNATVYVKYTRSN